MGWKNNLQIWVDYSMASTVKVTPMLVTDFENEMSHFECVGDEFEVLVTDLVILSLTFPISSLVWRHLNSVINTLDLSPTLSRRHHDVTNITVTTVYYPMS